MLYPLCFRNDEWREGEGWYASEPHGIRIGEGGFPKEIENRAS